MNSFAVVYFCGIVPKLYLENNVLYPQNYVCVFVKKKKNQVSTYVQVKFYSLVKKIHFLFLFYVHECLFLCMKST